MTKGSCLCGAVTYELTSLRDQLFFATFVKRKTERLSQLTI